MIYVLIGMLVVLALMVWFLGKPKKSEVKLLEAPPDKVINVVQEQPTTENSLEYPLEENISTEVEEPPAEPKPKRKYTRKKPVDSDSKATKTKKSTKSTK